MACSEKRLLASRKYYAKYPERAAMFSMRWAKNHPDKIKEYAQRAYIKNREKRLIGQRAWYHKNKQRINIDQAQKRRDNPELYLYRSALARAKKYKIKFNIKLSDIIIPDFCPILSVPISVGTKGWHQRSPSLDRIIPSKGYVRGNIAVISHRANRIKNDATVQELYSIIKFIKKYTKQKHA